MARRGPLVRLAVAAAAVALALTGCSGLAGTQTDANLTAVAFTGCESVACTGTLAGAPYEIVMPPSTSWNGTLLIYSHGYRQPTSSGAGAAVPAPGWDSGDKQVGQELLNAGYAIAGSAYKTNGWAVSDGIDAAEQIYGFFSAKIAKPLNVYAWGDSLGGLITEVLAERHPDWLSGAAPLCGVLAGVVPNLDLGFDVAYAVKQLIYPQLKLTGFASMAEAQEQLRQATSAVINTGLGSGAAKIAYIGAIADGPSQTKGQPGDSAFSKTYAYGEGIVTALNFSTVGRYDVEQRFGGNISGNAGTDYAARVSTEDATFITSQGGSVAAFNKAMASGGRVAPNPAAVAKAKLSGGDPTGNVAVPTITMHTQYDQVAVVQNESFFKSRYDRAPRSGGLLQLFTSPPQTYTSAGAPYGAGHCNFTPGSRTGIIGLLDKWVRSGQQPSSDDVAKGLGNDSGYNATFTPSSWPEQRAR